MKTRPIVAAALSSPSDEARITQAQRVFFSGNGLPQRWQHQPRFVVLETGFGGGDNFLATWQAWRNDPVRCERLVFIAIEPHPLSAGDVQRALEKSPLAALATQLVDAWPALTHNLHALDFEAGRVQLMLALGDMSDWLPELVAPVDAFHLHAAAWQPRWLKALARMASPGATLATGTAAPALRDGLRTAGFEVQAAVTDQHDITLARYAPPFVPRATPSRTLPTATRQHALIVGGGLAGCATAWALAQQGWRSTVFDRQHEPAQETSGNPAGLFHGIVNAQDGTHARFNRAAALLAQRVIGDAIHAQGVNGAVQGLLRLDSQEAHAMARVLAQLGLPADYVRAVAPAEASQLAGIPLHQAAWFYPGGGWVQPAALARAWLAQAGSFAAFRGGIHISRIHRAGNTWQLFDGEDTLVDEAQVLVLANAGDALRLLGQPQWPIDAVRGQISSVALAQAPGFKLPNVPLAGAGYLLPDVDGHALFGATSQPADMDGAVRAADHTSNLAQLARLIGSPASVDATALQGRTGWRWVAQDRLPVIGAVPDVSRQIDRPLDQPRFVPRLPGLHVFTALGSRGITWSALGARTLASLITGAPSPLEASLLDAIDPARFVSRAVRRNSS